MATPSECIVSIAVGHSTTCVTLWVPERLRARMSGGKKLTRDYSSVFIVRSVDKATNGMTIEEGCYTLTPLFQASGLLPSHITYFSDGSRAVGLEAQRHLQDENRRNTVYGTSIITPTGHWV